MLEHYGVELTGSRWGEAMVCCPAHGDRRPSMSVNIEKGVAYCHSCGFKGAALQLVMAMESCDRTEARERAERICREAGVEIKRSSSGGRYQRPGADGQSKGGGRKYVPPGRRSA